MKTITVSKEEIQPPGFITPPANSGQIVVVSYACTEGYILKKVYDTSDRSESVTAYAWPSGVFEPQSGSPKLGRKIGAARIE